MTETKAWTIPKTVLALLAGSRWQGGDGYSAFESVFAGDGDRQTDPSYYLHRQGHDSTASGNAFSGDEAWQLHRGKAFGPHSVINPAGTVCRVNEHAAHALADCLGEMSVAWAKYQDRLAKIPRRP